MRTGFAKTAALVLCTSSAITSGVPPWATARDYTLTADIRYSDGARHELDVYVPSNVDGAVRPVVVFFYGGGWETGRRERYRFVANALTRENFVAVVPDYRVYPDAVFPGFIVDAAKAVRWTKDHIAHFGGDPRRIFVMGHSAGAHIAAMLALDAQYLKSVGMTRAELRGMIGLAGPYTILPLAPERREIIFGPERERWRAQPINFVDGRNPPMLLLTGAEDTTVPPSDTHRLAAEIQTHHGPVTVIEYARTGHADLLTDIAAARNGSVRRAIAKFVREH